MAGIATLERSLGTSVFSGMSSAATASPAGNAVVVPRCTMRVEKCAGGAKIFCECDDELACATLQNLCKSLCDGLCSVTCLKNGMCLCQCNFALCHCSCEFTAEGVCLTCSSGDAACCQICQSCCECLAECLAAGCQCCLCFNGTPVCCGSC